MNKGENSYKFRQYLENEEVVIDKSVYDKNQLSQPSQQYRSWQ